MKAAFVARTSILTALGNSLDEMWPGAMGPLSLGATGPSSLGIAGGHYASGKVAGATGPSSLGIAGGRYASGKVAGATSPCKLAAIVLDDIKPVPPDTFVIWTGIKGNTHYIEEGVTDPPFLPIHYRKWVCDYLGLPDRGLEVNAACASSTVGLALAAAMIAEGEHSSVLVCAADIVSRFIFTGFSALKALSATKCRPFDIGRDGLCLGDGAAAILLADGETCTRWNYRPIARLSGWGIANDANHITGPARDGRGLVKSIASALEQARLKPDSIEAFCAHGTGTLYNDAMELTALETVFGRRRFPLFSIKGAVGHTLGAAGAIEAAVSIMSLEKRNVPPTTGLEHPEERAEGRASPHEQPFAGNNILTTNSGFGGCNAALILERI